MISPRQPPIFHERFSMGRSRQRSLAVGGDSERRLWQQNRPVGNSKRYKAVMKQVVGVPFTGTLSQSDGSIEETKIIQRLIEASKIPLYDPGMSARDKKRAMDSALEPAMDLLKSLLQARVKIYLESIAKRLLNPSIPLTWSATSNNCQSFCNSLIDTDLFEPLVSSERELYLMSFVCPQEGYLRNKVHTKYDVPSGLTEEYLLRFHFGRHDDADVIDTLQEYWYDWGAFGAPLYKYQDLFPWDCTEAYGKNPVKCGDCNLAKHILAFPFDAWSIVELHLARDQHMYAPPSNIPNSWMHNRLLILGAFSILTRAAAAMAKTPSFCDATQWLHTKDSELRGGDPALTRVKLGGIHRAQPFSHYFEAGKYSHYFLAQWALRPRNEQIEEYELLRDGRAKQLDVGVGGMFGSSTKSSDANDTDYWDFQQQFIGFEGGGLLPNDQSDDYRENVTGAFSDPNAEPENTPDTSNAHDPASEDSHRDYRDHSGNKDNSESGDHPKGGGDSTSKDTSHHHDTATGVSTASNTASGSKGNSSSHNQSKDGRDSTAQSQDTNHHRDNTAGASTASNTNSGGKSGTKDSHNTSSGDDGGSHKGHSGKRQYGETHHSTSHHHSEGHSYDRDDYSGVGSISAISYAGLHSAGGHYGGYSGGYSGGGSSSHGGDSSSYGGSSGGGSSSSYGDSSSYGGGDSSNF